MPYKPKTFLELRDERTTCQCGCGVTFRTYTYYNQKLRPRGKRYVTGHEPKPYRKLKIVDNEWSPPDLSVTKTAVCVKCGSEAVYCDTTYDAGIVFEVLVCRICGLRTYPKLLTGGVVT